MRHGTAVGRSIAGDLTAFTDAPYAWSDQYELSYQAIGRPQHGDKLVLRDGHQPDRFLAFWLRHDRLVAVLGLGAGRDIGAAKRVIERGAIVTDAVLRATDLDLRSLSREPRQPAPVAD
jgi:3-phenylpropionate/trans-cinnamate dioxygenase ferredoxin reductase subunit